MRGLVVSPRRVRTPGNERAGCLARGYAIAWDLSAWSAAASFNFPIRCCPHAPRLRTV